ncbi:MBL fold metallo-hydrolase [Cellulosimicrobium arenosum]|uniref:MBL fold metallo-hydrolase n=1 Tax=Cellulosimicrobium arenosum TaxID=2708133 RepID=A0A927G952_9MICO|nr:MBL fold metallo-hydrolase [Cellulosimicrobium arenosum]MBD8079247.1 MBL fold metallo-hydrolase [Cellulosimicrobium arenosum]
MARPEADASALRRSLDEVAPGVFVTVARLWSTTTTLVLDGTDALVVDPGVSVAEVDALASTILDRGWRVTAGLATHPHWDHVLWSRALGDGPRWATAGCADRAGQDGAEIRAKAQADAPGHELDLLGVLDALPPDATSLPWPGAPRVVGHDAHAPGHAGIATRGALLAGDMLSDAEVPLPDVSSPDPLGTYRDALDLLEDVARDAHVLVPGHGSPAVGAEAIARRFAADRAYLDALERAVDDPAATVRDVRLRGYVATWHADQLDALRDARR